MADSGLSVIQAQYGERVTRKSVVLHGGRVRDKRPALDGPASRIATFPG